MSGKIVKNKNVIKTVHFLSLTREVLVIGKLRGIHAFSFLITSNVLIVTFDS